MFIDCDYVIMKGPAQKTKLLENKDFIDKVFYKDSRKMEEIPDNSIQLIVTSPPYFNIKDYSLDCYQKTKKALQSAGQIGDINDYKKYI